MRAASVSPSGGLPVVGAIRKRLEQGVPEHGAKDFSATCLTSSPVR